MKTILKILPLLLVIVACSKDDGPTSAPENLAPEEFDLKLIPDNATNVALKPEFSWDEADDPEGENVTYDLYLGQDEGNMQKLAEDLDDNSFQIEESLLLTSEYFWMVVARDEQGAETESVTFSFTTRNLHDAVQATASAWFFRSTEIHATVYEGKLWTVGGNYESTIYNETWNTYDGAEWHFAGVSNLDPVYYHEMLTYDGKMWALCGHDGNNPQKYVYSTTDGLDWYHTSSSLPERYDHTALVFDGKMWMIAGTSSGNSSDYRNDVMYGTTNDDWTYAATNGTAAFSQRRGHSSVVFDGKMWVIGGKDANRLLNDVWYSDDGTTWTEATANADFPAREQHISEVFGGKMWVISGDSGGGTEMNDVWSSTDGVNWIEEYTNAAFTPRRFAASAVFDDKLWIIAGYDNVTGYVTDVWYME